MIRRKAIKVILAAGAASLSLEAAALAAADSDQLSNSPGSSTEAFSYSGHVVDEQGHPISEAEVTAIHHAADGRGLSYIDVVKSDATGLFTIYRTQAISGEFPAGLATGTVSLNISHPDFAFVKVENLQSVSRDEAAHLSVTMLKGRSLHGTVVDATHRPVAGALVEIKFADNHDQRRGALSDVNGFFAFHGLPSDEGVINVLAAGPTQAAVTANIDVKSTTVDAGTIALTPVTLPSSAVVHELFGMKLMDVDESLQTAFHLSRADGVLILDPGVKNLGLDLLCGDQFWIVGDKPVKDFAEFARHMLAMSNAPRRKTPVSGSVRVVYAFSRPEFRGTNTQYLALSPRDIAELSALVSPAGS